MKKSENTIEAELLEFMQSEGWRPTRNHVGLFRTEYGAKVHIGTKGFPDWSFTRGSRSERGRSELVHVEAKSSTKSPNPKQLEVIASLNHIGELATWTRNIHTYKTWYAEHFS